PAVGTLFKVLASQFRLQDRILACRLAPWAPDDIIEYLLSVHRSRCASVMTRVRETDHFFLQGVPELWSLALDAMASDDRIPDGRTALPHHVGSCLTDVDLIVRARSACLNALARADQDAINTLIGLAKPGFSDDLIRVLRHHAVQVLLASERIAD